MCAGNGNTVVIMFYEHKEKAKLPKKHSINNLTIVTSPFPIFITITITKKFDAQKWNGFAT